MGAARRLRLVRIEEGRGRWRVSEGWSGSVWLSSRAFLPTKRGWWVSRFKVRMVRSAGKAAKEGGGELVGKRGAVERFAQHNPLPLNASTSSTWSP